MTTQIAEDMQQELHPLGVAVMIESVHFCMRMRGIKRHNSSMLTSKLLGIFKEDMNTRNEFLSLVNKK